MKTCRGDKRLYQDDRFRDKGGHLGNIQGKGTCRESRAPDGLECMHTIEYKDAIDIEEHNDGQHSKSSTICFGSAFIFQHYNTLQRFS